MLAEEMVATVWMGVALTEARVAVASEATWVVTTEVEAIAAAKVGVVERKAGKVRVEDWEAMTAAAMAVVAMAVVQVACLAAVLGGRWAAEMVEAASDSIGHTLRDR